MKCPYCDNESAIIEAFYALEAMEPYAQRLVEEAAQKGEWYEKRWSVALQQARLILRAIEAVKNAATD